MTDVATIVGRLVAAGCDQSVAIQAATDLVLIGAAVTIGGPSKAAARTRKWRAKRASQTVTGDGSVMPANPASEASPNVTNRHRDVTGDSPPIDTSSNSNPIKDSPKEEKQIEAPPRKRPSRIPDDWHLEQRHIDYATSKGIAIDRVSGLGEKFHTHWRAATGKGSTSPDWFLKWCTWVMNDVEWNGKANGQRPNHAQRRATGADDFFAGLASVAEDIDRDGAMARPAAEDIPRGRVEIDGSGAARGDTRACPPARDSWIRE